MKIAILGYGKMGKEIAEIAISRGHEITHKISSGNQDLINESSFSEADMAIEFTEPSSAVRNIISCFEAGVPIISGTTGWNELLPSVTKKCHEKNGSLLYASNFSLGVNILFEINRILAEYMNSQETYEISIEETHHIHKLDKPSGTALSLGNDIIEKIERKKRMLLDNVNNAEDIKVVSHRDGEVIGTHTVKYENDIDFIEIKHFAKNRRGFALGAVLASEWLKGKNGVFTMRDFIATLTK